MIFFHNVLLLSNENKASKDIVKKFHRVEKLSEILKYFLIKAVSVILKKLGVNLNIFNL